MEQKEQRLLRELAEEWGYEVGKYGTYESLITDLKNDKRFDELSPSPTKEQTIRDFASELLSNADLTFCDICGSIERADDMYCFDYGDEDNEGDKLVNEAKEKLPNSDDINLICQQCYYDLLDNERSK